MEDLVCKFITQRLEKLEASKSRGLQINELINLTKVAYDFKLDDKIRNKCIDLLSANRGEIIQTEAWDIFAIDYPSIVSDMLAK